MPLTARHIVDPPNGWRFELNSTQTGERGVRAYEVDTHNIERVLDEEVIGLPPLGAPWSATRPTLKVIALRPERLGGVGDYGFCRVIVEYSTGSAQVLNAGQVGESYAVLGSQGVGFTAYVGLDDDDEPDPDAPPINQGDGVSVDTSVPEFRIRKFYSRSDFGLIDWSRFVRLQADQPLNEAAADIPRPQHLGGGSAGAWFTFGAGQLRYRGFNVVDAAGDAFGVEHVVLAAPDHNVRWTARDKAGKALGVKVARVLPYADFSGLW
jgi:hypothetical protein